MIGTPRHIDAPFWDSDTGELLLRLSCRPPFDPPILWEVRSLNGALLAYRSVGTEAGADFVAGHEKLSVDEHALRAALDRVSSVSLPLAPRLAHAAVCDGTTYSVTVEAGFATACRFSWGEGIEPGSWQPAIKALLALKRLLEGVADPAERPSANRSVIHVASRSATTRLVRLGTGEFQVWEPGEFGSVLCGFDYILVSSPIARFLQAVCGDDVAVEPARIVRRASGERWSSYFEVTPIAELDGPDDLPMARQSNRHVWHYKRGHLFVDGMVREALVALDLPDVDFSNGFSKFVGLRHW